MKYLKFLSPFEKLNLLIYTILIVALHLKGGIQRILPNAGDIGLVILGAISTVLLLRVLLIALTKFPRAQIIFAGIFSLAHIIWGLFHLRSHTAFDFSVIGDNISLLFYKESGSVIMAIFNAGDYLIMLGSLVALIVLIKKFNFTGKINSKFKLIQFLALIPIYVLIVFKSHFAYDEFTAFLKTVKNYYIQEHKVKNIPKEKFPYKKDFISTHSKKRPHVFFVTVESFNSRFAYTKNDNGEEYTPLFNQLAKQGWKIPNFYGHSVQTAKGQLGIFCSLLPLTRKKVFKHYERLRVHCLPHILKEEGYTNFFFKAYSKIYFDNTDRFAKQMGFDHIHAMDKNFISDEERKKYAIGWGIQDQIFYKRFFEYLDKIHKQEGENLKVFASLMTVTNHGPFKVPENKRILYKSPRNRTDDYANSIRLSDKYLETFFDELHKRNYLKNSIVIVTGDHGHPVGEHDNYTAVSGYYDENFRTPLLFWGSTITPKVFTEGAYSQIDLAPTVIDYLGISTSAPFMGRSIFDSTQRHIPLIQPYDGIYLGAVVYPYKYVTNEKTGKELCFNLIDDPLEQKNILNSIINTDLYDKFKKTINSIYLNDYLIHQDRIWPSIQ